MTFVENLYIIPKIEILWGAYLDDEQTSVKEIRAAVEAARNENPKDKSVKGYEATYWDVIKASEYGARFKSLFLLVTCQFAGGAGGPGTGELSDHGRGCNVVTCCSLIPPRKKGSRFKNGDELFDCKCCYKKVIHEAANQATHWTPFKEWLQQWMDFTELSFKPIVAYNVIKLVLPWTESFSTPRKSLSLSHFPYQNVTLCYHAK